MDTRRLGTLYRFGPFTLDVKTGELKKHGIRVKLQDQPLQVLELLLEQPGEIVTREEIQKRLWPTDVFVDFERSLNRAVVRLRQTLGDDSEAPRYVETIPRRGYRFLMPVETLVKEIGAGAQSSESNTEHPADLNARPASDPKRKPRSKDLTLIAVIIVLVVVAAAFLLPGPMVLDYMFWRQTHKIRSVAVLPLKNVSGDPDQNYFADGITDEITTDLARITSLRVVSATSSRHSAEVDASLAEIAKELNVDAVVEGSILRSDGRVRVNVQLIDVHNDAHLWAQIYERDAGEVLQIQDSIALDVAARVHASLKIAEREPRMVLPEAYDQYLRGKNELGKQRQGALRKGLEYFQQSVTLDRLYAPAYAGMADAYSLLANYGAMPPKEAFPRAKSASLKALELDPSLAEGHTALAYVNHHYDLDVAAAEKEYTTSIQLDSSNPTTRLRFAELLSNEGRHDQALREVRLAHELAPRSLVIQSNIGRFLYYARRYDEAITELQTNLAADPQRVFSRIYLALCYEQKRM